MVSVLTKVPVLVVQDPLEGVQEVLGLERFSSVFNLPGPLRLCNYLNLSLLLVQILSPVPQEFLSYRLLLASRLTSVAASRSSVAGVPAVCRLLPGLVAPPGIY